MGDASSIPATENRLTAGKAAARIVAGLITVALIAFLQLVLIAVLTMVSWKAAVAVELLTVGAAALLWRRRAFPAWFRAVTIATLVATAAGSSVLFWTTWGVHARHDDRLAGMAAELCSVELEGAWVRGCRGSISNTGNGNSCRYLVSASVWSAGADSSVIPELVDHGFRPITLDPWGDPNEDGRAYVLDEDGELRLYLQSSWQEDGGDMRCQ